MEEDEGADEQQQLSYRQRLKAAVHYTVGCLCEEVASDKEVQFSKQTIAAISEKILPETSKCSQDKGVRVKAVSCCSLRPSEASLAVSLASSAVCRRVPHCVSGFLPRTLSECKSRFSSKTHSLS
ncbi:centromere protein S isoform X3 [Rousettus aegyptiacus]|uniref:centromere protein S isoform X3 n=1 Tax=Rousettus aegyptiacus TaxID=9407 RepID=UPI00168CE8F8|nr:centromere protein S isoform X3 [Rousettus aegyptiacus]